MVGGLLVSFGLVWCTFLVGSFGLVCLGLCFWWFVGGFAFRARFGGCDLLWCLVICLGFLGFLWLS